MPHLGKARISIRRANSEKKLSAGEAFPHYYFLFEHGTTFDGAGVAVGEQTGIPVRFHNDDHYAGRPHMMTAHNDLVRLRKLGLICFQTNSSTMAGFTNRVPHKFWVLVRSPHLRDGQIEEILPLIFLGLRWFGRHFVTSVMW